MRFNVARLAAVIIIFASTQSMAQLTQQDINELRERGKQEGWTFTVGLCEANSTYSLEQLCGFRDSDNPITVR